jgi:hypothetical protein
MILLTISVFVPWTFYAPVAIPIIAGSLGLFLLLPAIIIGDIITDPVRKFWRDQRKPDRLPYTQNLQRRRGGGGRYRRDVF